VNFYIQDFSDERFSNLNKQQTKRLFFLLMFYRLSLILSRFLKNSVFPFKSGVVMHRFL